MRSGFRKDTVDEQSGSAVPVKAAILTLRRAINFAHNLQHYSESNTFRRQPRRQSHPRNPSGIIETPSRQRRASM
jgi:hypothetical protein